MTSDKLSAGTIAASDLRSWLTKNHRTQFWLAVQLGVRPETVARWLASKHRPCEGIRNEIQWLTDGAVAAQSWFAVADRASS